MLPECPTMLRTRLLSLFSNLSRFAGWLSFDLGDFDSSWYFYEQARSAAHEAENTELGAFVLCNMSHLATWQGKPRTGIDHAVAAQGWTRHVDDPLLRAYSCDVAARAYAFDGQRNACLAELEAADQAVGAATPDDDRALTSQSFAYFYGLGQLASTQSTCFVQLRLSDRATSAAGRALTLLDSSFVRNVAFTNFSLATAYTQQHEIEHAAEALGDAAALVARNRSMRLLRQLSDSRQQLEEWKLTRAVLALDAKLEAYGLSRRDST